MPVPSRSMRMALIIGVLALGATACSPIVDVDPASDAVNPSCAEVMVSLPEEVAGHALRETNSQATAAWGEPSQVVLRCGVAVPGPTTDECASVNDVDWLIRESESGDVWTATTYGRNPAVEVLFDPNQMASSTVLVDLGGPVTQIEQTAECLGLNDAVDLPTNG
ncbi:DUF3515 domain-containing protein [Arthrobacter sp. H5]|uniref:DUF3515 domain-containing protein n=1 Tax=Arthrobacter sp. H5 TaxID=1267973 RepID=UPI0004864D63|nr:DUF3515 domain-containing protein [Arthrobacter sp. H5]